MLQFIEFLNESKKKEKKIVFIENGIHNEFPHDTITSLQKEINKNCKDLSLNWKTAIELINTSFNNLDIPIPRAFQKKRWKQYSDLIRYAVKNLGEARGFNGTWATTI